MLLIGGLFATCGERNGINYMGSKHRKICIDLILEWTNKKGRLFFMTQGSFRALYSDAIIRVSPYPKKQGGFSDLFGFTVIDGKPIFTAVEVKTKKDSLSKDQKYFLDFISSMGGVAYVAMEDDSPEGYSLTEWVPC